MKSLHSFTYKMMTAIMIVMLALAAMPVSPSYANVPAPTFTNFGGTTGPVTITPAQFSCAAGNNRLLVVQVIAEYNNTEVMTLTVNKGVALTQAVKTTGNIRTGIWIGYLNDAQITANAGSNLVITEPAGGDQWQSVNVFVTCLTNVNQATPIVAGGTAQNGSDTDTGTYTFTNIPAVNKGLMIYAAGHNGTNNFTAPGGFTESQDLAGSNLRVTTGYKAIIATGNETGTINFNDTDRYAAAVVSINPAPPSTTTLVSSLNPSNVGDSVTFTATVTPGTATGTVTFMDGATPIGSGAVVGGVATFATTLLTAGAHNITAVYGGDVNLDSSTSVVLVQNVNGPPAILSADNTTFTVLTAGTFTVLASGNPAPTFTTAGPLPAGVTLSPAGVLAGTPATGTSGGVGVPFLDYPFVITAANGINPDATQNFTLRVQKRNQTINFNAQGSAQYGTTFNINPTASSGLTVTVTASGGCSMVTATSVHMDSATTNCVLTASQAGNVDYNAAANVVDTVTAQQASTTVSVLPSPHTFTNPSQSFYSHPMTFSVTVTSAGGTPTGTVTLTGGNPNQNITVTLVNGQADIPLGLLNVVTLLGAPIPHGLNIEYNGDANFDDSDEDVSHVIYPAPTLTTVTSNVNPSAVGQTVTFTVTLTTIAPGSGTPVGTVILYDGATPISGALTLTGGVATFNTSALAFGAHNITARYTNTNDNFATSTSAVYVQNVRRATTTTLVSNNNPSIYGENVQFTSTTTSTTPGTINGTVTFMDGTTVLGTDTSMVGGVANFTINSLEVGTHPITAVYSGNGTYATSTSAILDQVVNKATLNVTADDQTITYGDADPPFTFTYGGFVLGETPAVIDTDPTCTVVGAHVNVGTYDIECSGGLDNNYTFNFINGTLTVAQKTLTITADNRGKVFGDTVIFAGTEFTTNGLIFGDTVTSVTLTSAGAPAGATVAGSPYPIVPSAAVGTGLANYNIVYVNGLLTIGTNILTITANDQTKIYGDVFTFAGTEFTVTGLQGGDSVTSVTFTSAGTPSAAVVGTYPIVPSAAVGVGLGNYTIIYVNGQMDVNQRALSFNPNDQTKVYGSVFSAYTGAFTGLRAGDNITPIYDSLGAPAAALVGSYDITVTLDDPDGKLGNYIVTIDPLPIAQLTVTQKPLTITAANQSKPYGTDFIFAGTEFTVTGLTNGDTVTSVTLTSAGGPAAAVAGTYPITPSAAVGTGLGNYAIAYNDGTMTVTKPDLIVTSDGQTKVYGDVFTAFTGSIVGIQNGDNITATYASAGAPAAAPFGPYLITITLNDPDGKLINYNVIQNIGTLSVVKRDITVLADDKTKIYGDPVTLTATMGGAGVVPGDNITFTLSSPGTALTAPVGTYTIAVTLNDPLNRIGNYNYTATPGTLTVTLRDLVVTPDNKSKNYGEFFLAFTGTITGIQNGDNITANYVSTGSFPAAAVGPHPITTTLNDPTGKLGNYNVIINPATLTVGSSTLTVTAENKTILYGDPDPAFTFTYFGFAAGDTPAVIDTQPTCTVAGAHTAVGTYPIVCSGGVDNAYTFVYVQGTLTVAQRPLVVTPTNNTKVYGDLFTAFTGTITGIQGTDNITANYASAGAIATAAIGNYPITATLNDPGNVLSNYAVTLNTGNLSVIQRALTVTPADKTKVYGDVFTAFTGTITGIQNGDAITAIYASTGAVATATVAGSPYPITAVLNAPAGVLANYTITVNAGNLDVTQRTLVVTPDNKAKVFGTVFNAFTGVISGLQAGDNITATYASPGSPAAAAVGIYPITATLNDPGGRLPNYIVTLNTGTLNVALSVLNVTAENKIIVYGDPDPAFTFTYTGFIPPDTAAVVDTQPSCQVSVPHNNVGTFPIVCAGGVDNNYAFSYTPGTLTVTARPLAVTPTNQTKIYGDTFVAFTGTLAGIQGGDNITATYASAGAPAAATVAGSPYPITATLNDPGGRLTNYTVTLNTGTLTVTQRPLTATANDASKIYGNVFNAFTGTIVGIQNGDAITATYASAGSVATATVAGSPYPITATLNAAAGILANYNVTNNNGALTVTQRDLIIQPADKTKAFGTVFTAFTGSIVGIQNGDAITATYDSPGAPAAATVAGSPYPITAVANAPAGVLANYNVTIGGATLTVSNTVQTITINTPAPNNAANGSSFTVAATASSGLPVVYTATGSCTNVGATFTINLPNGNCIVHYNQPGNANFGAAPELTENVVALANGQTITVTLSAPAFSSPGSSFDVAATASSGLPVSITVSGVCTAASTGPGTATITIVSTNGTCDVRYNQAGNANFASAPQVIESTVIDNNSPTVTVNQEAVQVDPTNATPINFTVVFSEAVTGFTNADVTLGGTAGATTAVVTGAGGTYNVAVSGMTTDGTVTVSIPAAAAQDTAGNGNLASTSTDNSVLYFDGVGPNVQLLNTNPPTSDQVLSNAEVLTFNITHLKVKFNQDVYNPAGDSDPDDVTNPNNYILIRDLGDTPGVQTVSCLAGADVPADTNIAIGTVTYDSATHIATFTINSGLPLSNGDYHLFVCGTTSIVDPLNNALALVGSSGQPGTDFRGSFTVRITNNGGGGGGGGGTTTDSTSTTAALIPVTGFNPNQVTILPKQPADKTYKSLDDIRIEIPSLGISFPVVGVPETDNGWNLTWLKDSVGYLESSAYPTFDGNTVLTAHVRDANKNLGPFSDIKGMKLGDRILIHAYGKIYVYEVQENKKISSTDIATAFKHEEYAWVTLVTCEDYNAKIEEYHNRRMVRAVLISVVPEP